MARLNSTEKTTFIRDYGRALRDRNAALFLGAGMSIPAGFVDWKNLLREVADDIGLDIDKETDLISVAQFHTNWTNSRAKLNQLLVDEFARTATSTRAHGIIATLPITTIWTTNYDTLIEDALRAANRWPDVKHRSTQLNTKLQGSSVTVYKMHGDVSMADEAVITRDDYEEYGLHRQLFSERLKGDLVQQSFLFLGFSFSDPNIDYILSRVRVLMGRNAGTHYCLMKFPDPPDDGDADAKALYDYSVKQLELRIGDLKRYGVQTVLIERYEEITEILGELARRANAGNIFVSGSAHEYDPLGLKEVNDLCVELGRAIIGSRFNLVNGFGIGIGSIVSMAAMEAVYLSPGESLDSRVMLRPFPQDIPVGVSRDQVWTRYREEMIGRVGHAIFICGNKVDGNGKLVSGEGVRKEFEIAKEQGATLVPIGRTGWVANELFHEVTKNLDALFPGLNVSDDFKVLGDPNASIEDTVKATMNIIIKRSKQ